MITTRAEASLRVDTEVEATTPLAVIEEARVLRSVGRAHPRNREAASTVAEAETVAMRSNATRMRVATATVVAPRKIAEEAVVATTKTTTVLRSNPSRALIVTAEAIRTRRITMTAEIVTIAIEIVTTATAMTTTDSIIVTVIVTAIDGVSLPTRALKVSTTIVTTTGRGTATERITNAETSEHSHYLRAEDRPTKTEHVVT